MSGIAVAGPRHAPTPDPLFEYLLRLGDDRLVLGHRLSEWCGHGPLLEEDIALANIALDLIGHASLLLELAGRTEGKGRDADALAYFRAEQEFRNAQLVEQPNGDYAFTIVRQFLYDAYAVPMWGELARGGHAELAAIAGRAVKETTYHLRHSAMWLVRLGDGTAESHGRAQRALDALWRFTGELFETDDLDARAAASGGAPTTAAVRDAWRVTVERTIKESTLTVPADGPMASGGRRGIHTESLGHMLSDMQIVARSHPGASW